MFPFHAIIIIVYYMNNFLKYLYLVLIAAFVVDCTDAESSMDNLSHIVDSTSVVIEEEDIPNLDIRQGRLSQKKDTFRIVRNSKTAAVIRLGEPIVIIQAEKEEQWGYFQFPQIHRMGGTLLLVWQMRADSHTAYGETAVGMLISEDEGKTWTAPSGSFFRKDRYRVDLNNGDILQVYTPAAKDIDQYMYFPPRVNKQTTSDGRDFYYESELPDSLRGVYFDLYNHSTHHTKRIHASLDDPGLLRYAVDGQMPIVWWGNIKELPDGSLISGVDGVYYLNANGYIMRSSVSFFKSNNKGYHWNILGRIHYQDFRHDSYPYDGEEGFDEPTFEMLNDSTLFCVMRSGNIYPMYKTYSYDGGRNWTKPAPFTPNGVRPNLLMLHNGTMVLSSGRPGVQLRFCLDGDGKVWTEPVEMLSYMDENGSYELFNTCGYTSMLEIDDTNFYIVYSDFKRKNNNGEERKAIVLRKIEVIKI